MAKTTRTCPACNEATIIFTARNRKEVERYADYKIEHGHVCDACLKRQREEANAEAAAANADAGLPDLKGTEKQVAWAETIRAQVLESVAILEKLTLALKAGRVEDAKELNRKLPLAFQPNDIELDGLMERDPEIRAAGILAFCEVIREQHDAGWWIDNRNGGLHSLVLALHERISDRVQGAPREDEIIEEVAVKPAAPVTTEVVEVVVAQKRVTAKLPEKREDFRDLVKGLGYRWDADVRVWALPVGPTLGAPEDRAAELMHRLLEAGFIVACQRAEVREKALAASYEPVYPRWIASMKSGRFQGWLQVIIRDDLDIREDLKRLGGKEDFYQAGIWYVRPGCYATLRDLAEVYGLRLTPGADEALTKAQRADEARLLAEDLPEAPSAAAEGKEPGREIPGDIDPELKDD